MAGSVASGPRPDTELRGDETRDQELRHIRHPSVEGSNDEAGWSEGEGGSVDRSTGVSPRCDDPSVLAVTAAIADQHQREHVNRLRVHGLQCCQLNLLVLSAELASQDNGCCAGSLMDESLAGLFQLPVSVS